MTIERVENAAWLRGIYFDGVKRFRNSMVGCAYEIYSPDGRGFYQADTLRGMYDYIMQFPKVRQ